MIHQTFLPIDSFQDLAKKLAGLDSTTETEIVFENDAHGHLLRVQVFHLDIEEEGK